MKACEKCGAVFVSDSLLMDYENNDHVGHGESEFNEDNPEEILLKKQQFHCCLVDAPSCQFQCETKEELKHHIEIKHRFKPHLQCTVCKILFRNLENLAKHTNMAHKKDADVDSQFTCRRCQMKFETRSELDVCIIDEHKSHKPCRNFADNSCEYTEHSCRFNNIILKQGQHLCYKCGDILARK